MGSFAPALTALGDQSTAGPMSLAVLGLALVAVACFLILCRPWRPIDDPLLAAG